MTRPLWKTLLSLVPKNSNHSLTCDECFELLEYLIETSGSDSAPELNEDRQYLQDIATVHLQQCPHCQQHHLDMLNDMEAGLKRTDDD